MFKRIMVPITAEALPAMAIKRAASICKDFSSRPILLYIIDPKLLELMDQASSYALSPYDRELVREDVTTNQALRARDVILNKTKKYFRMCNKETKQIIHKGDYCDVITKVARDEKVDMIFMEYQEDTELVYRILHSGSIPIWIDRGRPLKKILVLASNLAPNRKGPMYAADLANMYNSEVDFCYVMDPSDPEVSKKLLYQGKRRIKAFKAENPDINVESSLREGNIEEILPTLVKQFGSDLVVMGRFKKIKKRFFGLLSEDVKTKMAKTLDTNILAVR